MLSLCCSPFRGGLLKRDLPPLDGLPKLGKGSQTVVLARSLTRSHSSRSTRDGMAGCISIFHPNFPLTGQVISVI